MNRSSTLTLLAIYAISLWSCRSQCVPERPSEVPEISVYVGGCDGGVWIWEPGLPGNIDTGLNEIQLNIYGYEGLGEVNAVKFICNNCNHSVDYILNNIDVIDWNYFDGEILSYRDDGTDYMLGRVRN